MRTYPFGPPRTKETLPNRMNPELISGKIVLNLDVSKFTNFTQASLTDQGMKDFCLDRIAEYHQALELAEHQIIDMQAATPFIPEDLGFALTCEETIATVYTIGSCMISRA